MNAMRLYFFAVLGLLVLIGISGFDVLSKSKEAMTVQDANTENSTQGSIYSTAALWESIETVASTSIDAEELNVSNGGEEDVNNVVEEKSAFSGGDKDTQEEQSTFSVVSFIKELIPKQKGCPETYAPICGNDGVTYKNSCIATEKKAGIAYAGICASTPPPLASEPTAIPEPSVVEKEALEVSLEGAYPDFSVRALSYYGGRLSEGEQLSFSVVVLNEGNVSASTSFYTGLYLDLGNDEVFEIAFTEKETRALGVGESETKIWRSAWIQVPGTHTLGACADSTKIIIESLEKNNCDTIEFTVPGIDENADLEVISIEMSPANPVAGTNVSFSARVRNHGVGIARSSVWGLWVYGDGPGVSLRRKANEWGRDRADFSAGEEGVITKKTIWKATIGEYTYRICADPNNEIREVNEEDNCKEKTFTVFE